MSNVIDGVSIDVPPLESQIIALAHHHHRKLLIFGHFPSGNSSGDYCLHPAQACLRFCQPFKPRTKGPLFIRFMTASQKYCR